MLFPRLGFSLTLSVDLPMIRPLFPSLNPSTSRTKTHMHALSRDIVGFWNGRHVTTARRPRPRGVDSSVHRVRER